MSNNKASRDNRSNQLNPNNPISRDNRANQLNPNNPDYWKSHENPKPPSTVPEETPKK